VLESAGEVSFVESGCLLVSANIDSGAISL